jgi:phage tail sheath protein FI
LPEYLTPGVYFEFRDSAPALIRQARTDIAGFVGLAERGPLQQAVRIDSWRQFQAVYGAFLPFSYLAFAVKGFFENGGRTCFVVRTAGNTARRSSLPLLTRAGLPLLRLYARSEGSWGDRVSVMLTGVRERDLEFSLVVTRNRLDRESFPRLSLRPEAEHYYVRVINEGSERQAASRWVWVEDELAPAAARGPADLPALAQPGWRGAFAFLDSGQDGLASLTAADLIGQAGDAPKGLAVLEKVDPVGIVAIPDMYVHPVVVLTSPPPVPPPVDPCCPPGAADQPAQPDSGLAEQPPAFSQADVIEMQRALIEHCERLRDRVAILEVPDRPSGGRTPAEALAWRSQMESERGYAALYYPWLRVLDPLQNAAGPVRAVPPCGHIAGLYARTDFSIGVHGAPANAGLAWAEDLTAPVDEDIQAVLNPEGVNCLRAFPGRGLRVYGARTISSNPDWRFINVRRLLIMIEQAIDESTQWAVFEPHNFSLRQTLTLSISGFLNGLWRRGGLVGSTVDEAFYVKCDETNNPPAVVDAGQLVAEIGVAPTIPAEFVIFRIGRTTEELEIIES